MECVGNEEQESVVKAEEFDVHEHELIQIALQQIASEQEVFQDGTKFDLWMTVSGQLMKFKDNDFLCDTVLISKSDKRFKAHSLLLAAFSSVFEVVFQEDNVVGTHLVNLPMFDDITLEVLLHFIYAGKLLLPIEFTTQDGMLPALFLSLKDLGLNLNMLKQCPVEIKRTDTEVNIDVNNDGDIVSIAKNDTELQETTDIPKYSGERDDCENANNQRSVRKAKSRRGRKPSKKVIENLEAVALEYNESILNEISVEKNKRSKVSKNRSLIKVEEEMKSESNHDLFTIKTESNPFGYECSRCKNIYENHSTFSNHKCEPTQNSDGTKLEDSQESSNSKKVHESVGKKKYQYKQPSVVCHLCGMSLKTGSMRSHIESRHEKRQSYKCTECEMAFHTDTSRYKHFMKVHKTRVNGDGQEYLCETCGKDFNDSISLYHHVYGHKHKKSVKKTDVSTGMPVIHKCCYCNKTFEQKSSMIRHVRMHQEHNKDLPYVCQECGKRFVFKSLFVKHQTVHKPDRPFDCSVCKKKFKTKNCVDNHMRITHSVERKFRCSLCGDCFKQNHHLAQHMVHHSDERPFACLICDKSYKVKHDLKLHCKRVHQTDLFPSLYYSGSRMPDQNEKLKSESNEAFKSEQNVEPGYELSLNFCNKIL